MDVTIFQHIENLAKKIKSNIQIIILVPTIIGGLWQILELSLISTSMIRFFSISQLVADGLLILFFGGVLYIAYKIGKFPLDKNEFSFLRNNPQLNNGTYRNNLIWCSLTFVLTFGLLYFLYLPLIREIQSSKHFELPKIFWLIISGYFILILALMAVSDFIKIVLIQSRKYYNRISRESILFKFINPIKEFASVIGKIVLVLGGLFLLLFVSSSFIGKFRSSYLFPNRLINIKYLNKNAENYYSGPIDSTQILYMNDKYIFLKVFPNTDNKDILILKFKDILVNPYKDSVRIKSKELQ